jgi:membrane-bound metal-dependent hydrolase YbcI (DUF457 family)
MMGRQHALSGVLAATGTAYAITADVPTFVLLCTTLPGTALLPDIDHQDSTVSNVYGPVTRTFALVLKHRKQTHSIPGVLVFSSLVYAAAEYANEPVNSPAWWMSRSVLLVVLILIYASTLRLFKIKGWLDDFLPIPVCAVITYGEPWLLDLGVQPFPFRDLPLLVALGMFVHILGDWVTKQPIPVLWPFSSRGSALGLFRAGGRFELMIVLPLILVGSAGFGAVWIMEIM